MRCFIAQVRSCIRFARWQKHACAQNVIMWISAEKFPALRRWLGWITRQKQQASCSCRALGSMLSHLIVLPRISNKDCRVQRTFGFSYVEWAQESRGARQSRQSRTYIGK